MNRLVTAAAFGMAWLLAAILPSAGRAAAEELTLENDYVRVTVETVGGVVKAMHHRHATTFPLIADKGAGVAGTGRFLAAHVRVGERRIDLAALPMRLVPAEGDAALALAANLPAPAEGVTWVRVVHLRRDESGFRVEDQFHNAGEDIALRVGASCRQQAEPWRKNLRCWFGDRERNVLRVAPAHAGEVDEFATATDRLFWRVLSQYGIGLLIVADLPGGGEAVHHLPAMQDCPASFTWTAREATLPKGGSLTIQTTVMIDEGGRQGNDPSALVASDRTIATVDLRAAGMPGDALPAALTLASADPRRVNVLVSQYGLAAPGSKERLDEKTLARLTLDLKPGRAAYHPLDVTAGAKGLTVVEAVVADEQGRTLITSSARALIDGADAEGEWADVWRFHNRRLPEESYKGTWEEIGRRVIAARPQPATDEMRKRLAFYEKHFPLYARMLRGAAAARNVEPAQLAALPADGAQPPPAAHRTLATAPVPHTTDAARPLRAALARAGEPVPHRQSSDACMNVFFNGPDGPLNAYSKERSGTDYAGLKYAKIIPDEGYRFHAYSPGGPTVSWGINSAGLSMTAASLCPDAETERITDARLAEWRAAGGFTAPMWPWMVLATCKNVEEAIALITKSEAPVAGEVNVLLVDREGNAAKVQGWGITHVVTRYKDKGPGFFAVGNYPIEQPDGLFKIGNWGYAANTMLRERFLWQVAGARDGQISLKDAVALMESHAAGGMCQHLYDNPGGLFSNTSFIAVARTGELWVSHGPPCRARYQRYTLDDD